VLVHRSTTRRIALLVLGVATTAGVGALSTGTTHAGRAGTLARPADTLGFEVEYGGMGAEGVDLLWRGHALAPLPGFVTIRMEYAGSVEERRMPIWPVNVWLFYSADDLRSSFAAELSGSMNWRTGELGVSGIVSDGGRRRGVPLDQRLQLHRPGLAGTVTLVFLPPFAMLGARPHQF
jgi:hypothetical protein